jgi:hypothetical protein
MTAVVAFGAAGSAQAAIGDGVLGARAPLTNIAQIEKAQFFFGGQNYCWYDDGWQGPGWYWCGYNNRSGLGWGGGAGFHGWRRGGGGGRVMHGGGVFHGGMSHGGGRMGGGRGGGGRGHGGPHKH